MEPWEPNKDEETHLLIKSDIIKDDTDLLLEAGIDIKTESDYFSAAEIMYPPSLQLNDRLTHAILFMIGAMTYLAAAIFSLPYDISYSRSGWFLTIGSFAFLFASLQMIYCTYLIQKKITEEEEEAMILISLLNFENDLNDGFILIGEILNIVGSAMLIPANNRFVPGEYVFMVGSGIIFLAYSCRVYRLGLSNTPQERIFDATNYKKYPLILSIETSTALFAFFYSWTSLYFLNRFLNEYLGGCLYACGGFFAILAGILLFHKQIFMHDNKLQCVKDI
jgi:hypothetical protein